MSEDIVADGLAAIESQAWSRLETAATDPGAPFRNGQIATIGDDGPEVRTVVMRGANPLTRRILFHTDRRSPKFSQLGEDNRVAWIAWDEESRLQLRLQGSAILHTDDAFADDQWARTPPGGRRVYRATSAPGSVTALARDGLPPIPDDQCEDEASQSQARSRFAVVEIAVTRLDALYLLKAGHRRAVFRYDGDGVGLEPHWLIP